jgi:hypothetical protein
MGSESCRASFVDASPCDGVGRSAGECLHWCVVAYLRAMTDPKPDEPPPDPEDVCDLCGSDDVVWIQCKLMCRNCGSLVKSCADLGCA